MSKAQIAIEQMIADKQRQINEFIDSHRDVLIPFAGLRLDLQRLEEQRKLIYSNRLEKIINNPCDAKTPPKLP